MTESRDHNTAAPADDIQIPAAGQPLPEPASEAAAQGADVSARHNTGGGPSGPSPDARRGEDGPSTQDPDGCAAPAAESGGGDAPEDEPYPLPQLPSQVAAAVERGWSVVPVGADKRPLLAWAEYQQRRATVEELRPMLAARAVAAWAVVTGRISGVIVLDFDGDGGQRTLERLGVAAHVRTGSGGHHVYVTCPGWPVGTVHQGKRALAQAFPGMDVRGDGGYAVFAGRNLQGPYEWLRDPEPEAFAQLPEPLRALLGQPHAAPNGGPSDPGESLIRRAVNSSVTRGRNETGFALARQLRDRGWSREDAEQVMRSYAARVGPRNLKGQEEEYSASEALASLAQAYKRPPAGSSGDNPDTSQQGVLLQLAGQAELFHTQAGWLYATVPVGDHRETHLLDSQRFASWLRLRYLEQRRRTVGAQAVRDTVATLAGRALFHSPQRTAHVRVAGHDGAVWIDLCDDTWQAVRVTADGWQIAGAPPVAFRRAKGMTALPTPVGGGHIDELRGFVNINDDQWPLLVGGVVSMLRPAGPFPLIDLVGVQGSAKSTTARMLRRLVDPNVADLRADPTSGRDLMVSANNAWALAFDNLSGMRNWLSDALCRLSTGGGFGTRQLYTDSDETIFDAQRPVVLTGIEEVVTRGDLLDRSLLIELPPIPKDQRRTEEQLWDDFDAARPRLLGALLDAVACALRRLPDVRLDEHPRMADVARWVTAAEPALGLADGAFVAAHAINRQTADDLALEASPITTFVAEFARRQGHWKGSATDLLTAINLQADEDDRNRRDWPRNPQTLGSQLRRIAPHLPSCGVDISFLRPGGRRLIAITYRPENDTFQQPR